MKQYLSDFFRYNDWANNKLLEAIRQLPDNSEPAKLFSHLISSQDKWFNRVTQQVDDNTLLWFGPVFPIEELADKWKESVNRWLNLLERENKLDRQIYFNRAADGKKLEVKLIDIMLQLNYHSIHHRAQINTIIRQQGLTPPSTDYILTALREP